MGVPLDPPPSGTEREWLDAFYARGGTIAMLRQTMVDADLMDRVIDVIQKDARVLLEASVATIHTVREGLYEFVDPGVSLLTLSHLPLLQERNLLKPYGYMISGSKWWKKARPARRSRISFPIEGSFNLPFSEQRKLLAQNQQPIGVSVLVTFLMLRALSDGTRLLHDRRVRTGDMYSQDLQMYVGPFTPLGLQIGYCKSQESVAELGLAASTEWTKVHQ